jgi:predicted N-acetyltransferase YhbS
MNCRDFLSLKTEKRIYLFMEVSIRKEQPTDYQRVFDIVELAFRTMPFADGDEQFLVVSLRKNAAFIPELSLVAEVDHEVVGHIMFTPLQVVEGDKVFNSLTLAPVSVHPDYQHQGVGSKLIEEGHRIARNMGFTSCFLLGHPEYYPRFGYGSTAKWGIPPPHGAPPEAFMAIELIPGALNGVTGVAKFLPEFGIE